MIVTLASGLKLSYVEQGDQAGPASVLLPGPTDALLDVLARDLLKVPPHVWRKMFAALLSYDDSDELDRITSPALLIWGDADGVVSREMQDQLTRSLSRSELVVYPGVGHTPRWEAPTRFAADATSFAETLG